MYASVRTTVLPDFCVEVYPSCEDDCAARQAYILTLRDGTAGVLDLVFPSAQDLRAFLAMTRAAFATARHEARARKARLRRFPTQPANQTTLF